MHNNAEFVDLLDAINNIAKGYGFKNGLDWATEAQKKGEIDCAKLSDYSNCHNLRIRYSHGSAKDINVSDTTLNKAKRYLSDIKRSHLRKRKTENQNGGTKPSLTEKSKETVIVKENKSAPAKSQSKPKKSATGNNGGKKNSEIKSEIGLMLQKAITEANWQNAVKSDSTIAEANEALMSYARNMLIEDKLMILSRQRVYPTPGMSDENINRLYVEQLIRNLPPNELTQLVLQIKSFNKRIKNDVPQSKTPSKPASPSRAQAMLQRTVDAAEKKAKEDGNFSAVKGDDKPQKFGKSNQVKSPDKSKITVNKPSGTLKVEILRGMGFITKPSFFGKDKKVLHCILKVNYEGSNDLKKVVASIGLADGSMEERAIHLGDNELELESQKYKFPELKITVTATVKLTVNGHKRTDDLKCTVSRNF